jgi:hypothetical protein
MPKIWSLKDHKPNKRLQSFENYNQDEQKQGSDNGSIVIKNHNIILNPSVINEIK